MPRNIYSKQDESLLLLTINKFAEIDNQRTDLCPDSEFLQISTKRIPKGTTFAPHRHNPLERKTTITQEAWVILEGKIRATFYDLDNTVIEQVELVRGDCAVVYYAGHGFEVLEEGTVLYELKSGPYFGVEKDKTFITNKGENDG
jgi:cupin fold WbuC family metalloprotein